MPGRAPRLEPVVEIPVRSSKKRPAKQGGQSTTAGPTSHNPSRAGKATRNGAKEKGKEQEGEGSPELGVEGEEAGEDSDSDEEVSSSLIPKDKGKAKAVEPAAQEEDGDDEEDQLAEDDGANDTDYDDFPPTASTAKHRSPTQRYGKKGSKTSPAKSKKAPKQKEKPAPKPRGRQPKKKVVAPAVDEDEEVVELDPSDADADAQAEGATPPPAAQRQTDRQSEAPPSPRKHLSRRAATKAAKAMHEQLQLPQFEGKSRKEQPQEEEEEVEEQQPAQEEEQEQEGEGEEDADGDDDEVVAQKAPSQQKKRGRPRGSTSGSPKKSPRKKKKVAPSQAQAEPEEGQDDDAAADADEHDNGAFSGVPQQKNKKKKKGKRAPAPAAEFHASSSDEDVEQDGHIPVPSDVDEPDPEKPPELFMHLNAAEDEWVPDRIWLHDDAGAWREGDKEKWAARIERHGGKVLEQISEFAIAILPDTDAAGYEDIFDYVTQFDATPVSHMWLSACYSRSRDLSHPYRYSLSTFAAPRPPGRNAAERRARKAKKWKLTPNELKRFAVLYQRHHDPEERDATLNWVMETMQREFFDGSERTTISGFQHLFKTHRAEIRAQADRVRHRENERREKKRRATERLLAEEAEADRGRREFSAPFGGGDDWMWDGAGAEAGPSGEGARERRRREEQTTNGSAKKRRKDPLFDINDSVFDDDDTQSAPRGDLFRRSPSPASAGSSRSASVPPPRRPLRAADSPSPAPSRGRSPSWAHSDTSQRDEAQEEEEPPLPLDDITQSLAILSSHFGRPHPLVRRINLACSFSLLSTRRVLHLLREMGDAYAADPDDYDRLQALHLQVVDLCWSAKADKLVLSGAADAEVAEMYRKSEEEVKVRREEVLGGLGWEVVERERWFPSKAEVRRILAEAAEEEEGEEQEELQ
ncbi:hypothetical protein JCM6882_009625 [Rhodosporidiobolus microsporus]